MPEQARHLAGSCVGSLRDPGPDPRLRETGRPTPGDTGLLGGQIQLRDCGATSPQPCTSLPACSQSSLSPEKIPPGVCTGRAWTDTSFKSQKAAGQLEKKGRPCPSTCADPKGDTVHSRCGDTRTGVKEMCGAPAGPGAGNPWRTGTWARGKGRAPSDDTGAQPGRSLPARNQPVIMYTPLTIRCVCPWRHASLAWPAGNLNRGSGSSLGLSSDLQL